MLALSIQFLAGRFHRSAWARCRDDTEVEWPPNPRRLLEAIATAWIRDGQRDRDTLVNVLERLTEPPCYLLPRATAGDTRHSMLAGGLKGGKPVRTRTLDSFIALDRGREPATLAYAVWPQVELRRDERTLLERCCLLIRCLGYTEASCVMRVVDAIPNDDALEVVDIVPRAARQGPTVRRLSVDPSLRGDRLLGALARKSGEMSDPRGLVPLATAWVDYRLPPDFLMVREQYERPERTQPVFGPTLLRFALGRGLHSPRPSIKDAVVFGDLLRAAAIRRLSEREGEPATHRLAGKAEGGSKREGHDHPYFLPFDEEGRGEIDGIDVWFPRGCTHAEYIAVTCVPELREHAVYKDNFPLTFVEGVQRPRAAMWRTATPIVLERFPKIRGTNGSRRVVDGPEAQVAEMVRRATGRDAEIEIWAPARSIDRVSGGHLRIDAFRRGRIRKPMPPLPVVGATIGFDGPVEGPIVLGVLAHFGLGRFDPIFSDATE